MNLSFTPKTVTINLKTKPILDLKFSQFKAFINGTIECTSKCFFVI